MNNRYFRTIVILFFLLSSLARTAAAGDEPAAASGQWREDLRRLVTLSRFAAEKPSTLLGSAAAPGQTGDLSSEPFGCGTSEMRECLLSRIAGVLSRQAAGSEHIFDAPQQTAVRITYTRATDVWLNKDIENNWDVIKKWTDAAGPATLLVGALMLSQQKSGSSSDAAATIIGSGAGLILIGNIGTLGQLYGGVNDKQRAHVARKTINALQEIEASRQAYEDSRLVYGFFEGYCSKSEKQVRALAALSKEAGALMTEPPSLDASKRIVAFCDKTREAASEFKEAARLARDYAGQLSTLYSKYGDEVALPGDKKKFGDALEQVKLFNEKFDEVIIPFLEGVPDEIEAVRNIKAAVIARGIADKQYF